MSESSQAPDAVSRRDFLKKSSLLGGFMVLPSFVAGVSPTERAPNSKLNIAFVGVGGMGRDGVRSIRDENFVAFCDVHPQRVFWDREHTSREESFYGPYEEAEKRGARWFSDYREMFAEMSDEIDVVVIATPDHMHFPIAMSALQRGKHVYCQKPLTHTIEEARLLTEAAAKAGVVTQMGNQGRSSEGFQLVREWIAAGIIGPVHEVHSWTNRPIWPQGMSAAPDHSKMIPVPPESLQWDLWLGTRAERPYDPAYVPSKWRGWWDFGTGALGDMACHLMDAAWTALDLGYPEWVEAAATGVSPFSPPQSSVVTYQFPANGSRPPVLYKWYDGDMRPPLPPMVEEYPTENPMGLTFIVGEEATLLVHSHSGWVRVLPREKFRSLRSSLPPKTLPRVKGNHYDEFLRAIREGRRANSDFASAGPFTEMVLLSVPALRSQRRIEFDARSMRIPNAPEAEVFLRMDRRPGWIV